MSATQQSELPQFLRDMIASTPRHGDGVHQWLYRVARQLHAHRTPAEICGLLSACVADCGRAVPESEIVAAVENAGKTAWKPSGSARVVPVAQTLPKWPERDTGRISAIAAADPDAFDKLRGSSPFRVSPELHDAESVLERLFPGDPLLCVAAGVASARVLARSELRGIAGKMSHIVPSPMTATAGTNKQGLPSPRCLDNTGPRTYLITEFDHDTRDTQAAVIRHLARLGPLALVVDSAGKSLHAWWRCSGQPEERIRAFFRRAVSLGADPATWTRCQLVRMPLGLRDGAKRQLVHFYEPHNTGWAKLKGGAS